MTAHDGDPNTCATPDDHYFPSPDEFGCDPQAFPGGPDAHGDCACGARWADQPDSVRNREAQ